MCVCVFFKRPCAFVSHALCHCKLCTLSSVPVLKTLSKHIYFDVLCLKEHVFTHRRQRTRLVTCGKGKFRWLDYPNLSALDKSCEMYSFHRCFSSCRRCKKGKIPGWSFFFETYVPVFVMAIMFNYWYTLKSSFVAHTYKLGEPSILCEQHFYF